MTPAPDFSDRPLAEMWRLDARVALVTGAGRGIGEAVSRRLAEAGATVAVADVQPAGAQRVADAIQDQGWKALPLALDVTVPDAIAGALDELEAQVGSPVILVNNAGVMPAPMPLVEIDTDEWDRVFDVNVTGIVKVTRDVAGRMIRAGKGGVIVNLASTASFRFPSPGTLLYSSSKHAVNALTKGMAVELGGHGIRVMDVAPTMTETPGIEALRAEAAARAAAANEPPRIGQPSRYASLPLGRQGVPDDIARVIVFMVSDLAAMLTGSSIPVDAGALVQVPS
jgi:NAD(P)-dependent dehydrogenase (short-subunit alcohol dehydrogenase family)